MVRYLPVLLDIALTVYCLIDCIQTDEVIVRNLPKTMWVFVILLFPVVGPIAWLVAGRPSTESRSSYLTQQERWEADYRRKEREREMRERRQSPRGPDDDPDFLKGI